MTKESITQKLYMVQNQLHAPKGQKNTFGKYAYRSCEDILKAVKPLLHENGLSLTLSDDILQVGERIYVKSTATLSCVGEGGTTIWTTAYARECQTKKGMDEAQITGAASSYARKYALNGLFAIDDSRDDPDTKPPPGPSVIGKVEADILEALLTKTNSDRVKFLSHYKTGSMESFPVSRYTKALAALNAKAKKIEVAS